MMSEDLSSRTVSRRGLLAAAFAAGGMLATLAGCSSGDPTDAAAASDGSSKGTLKVAMELAYPPFETRDEQGEPTGISVTFMRDFGEAYGYDIQIENTAWDGLIPSLQTGAADCVISSMTITDEREEQVDFTDPYAVAQLAILANASSGVASIDDLNQAANPDTTTAVYIPFQDPEYWGIAVANGNDALREELNAFIAESKENGEFDRLTDQYLSEEHAAFEELGFRWFFDFDDSQEQANA